MEVIYANANVEECCKNIKISFRRLGAQIANKLNKRISQLMSFDNLYDVMNSGFDNPHILTGDIKGYIAWDINENYRLILDPLVNMDQSFKEETKNIRKIEVKGVVDYHGGTQNWILC
ncbi:MAG: hypothetical protein LKJ88_02965 [Bacilli bacterium]|jgi:plasmid maintenance system killer protein|nr:hypothetical protein [Bacilli bacterium]